MEVHTFFLILMVILLTARVLAEVAVKLHAPAVIGELLAGVFLGPSLLGWITPTEVIRLLAEIGIILLLFEVGLETDVRKLAAAGAKSLIVAAGGVVLPFLFGFGLAKWGLHLDTLPALFIGGTLTATASGSPFAYWWISIARPATKGKLSWEPPSWTTLSALCCWLSCTNSLSVVA